MTLGISSQNKPASSSEAGTAHARHRCRKLAGVLKLYLRLFLVMMIVSNKLARGKRGDDR
jgi:hypothetical protein